MKSMTVVAAGPVYACTDCEVAKGDRLAGSRIVFQQVDGVSTDEIKHILQCHSMRTMLGLTDSVPWPNDPFSLPGTWVNIEVRPEAGTYATMLAADSVAHNLELLARAKAFAKAKIADTGSARRNHDDVP